VSKEQGLGDVDKLIANEWAKLNDDAIPYPVLWGENRKRVESARTELAALRRRAEDAELIANAALRGSPNDYRTSDGTWRFCVVDDCGGHTGQILRLQHDPTTGLPVLTDEAREALKT